MKQTNKKKWNDIVTKVLVKIIPPSNNTYVTTVRDVLWDLYTCDERKYHTTYHVVWMFEKAQEKGIELTPAQELAILFHDAIYTPGAEVPKNEFASSGLLRCLLTTPLVGREDESERMALLESASRMVENTALHFAPANSIMEMEEGAETVLDLDLANLGSSYAEFCQWGAAVMEEIPEATVEGRIKFLKSMLKRKVIFMTPEFEEEETAARENMQKWIDENG